MNVQENKLTVSQSEAVNEKIKSIYINYLQMMLDAAKDPKLKEELFASNEKRLEWLNDKVGMNIPENVHVNFDTKNLQNVTVYVRNKEDSYYIVEGPSSLKIIEQLNSGEVKTESMALSSQQEVVLKVDESMKESKMVVNLPFADPSSDMLLFELKYNDNEIVFSTCIGVSA